VSLINNEVPGRAILIAGTHSGAGKTTASLVLMSALSRRGLRVQPFKVGPDFIDAGYHRLATGQPSINLDLWMMGLSEVRRSLEDGLACFDVSLLEGLGGLFDGENGVRDRGSSAFLARTLKVPVILVLDIWGMTRSAAAVVRGFIDFDARVRIEGLILNRAGSCRHYEMVLRALPPKLRSLCFGYLLNAEAMAIPERHLGLVTPEENPRRASELRQLWAAASRTVDTGRLVRHFRLARRTAASPPRRSKVKRTVRIAVARDRAFCFYYADNLRRLKENGAEIVFFSPIGDAAIPPGTAGIYIGGGYPESFARELAGNTRLARALAQRAASGMPIYAECGGLMYLARSLTDFDRVRHSMAGILPVDIVMDRKHLAIRYVKMTTLVPTVLGPAGTTLRGQEFHQSRVLSRGRAHHAYAVKSSTGESFLEGLVWKEVLGTYLHAHFASNPALAASFVSHCVSYMERLSKTQKQPRPPAFGAPREKGRAS
jgi:cobyrinic acid a,c-diamide synthase